MTLGVLLVWGLPREGWCGRLGGRCERWASALALRGDRVPRQGRQRLAAAAALLVGDPRAHRLGVPGCRQPLPRDRVAPRDPDGTPRALRLRRARRQGGRFRLADDSGAARGRHRRDARRGRARGLPARRPGASASCRSQGSPWRFAAGALGCAAAFGAAGLLLHTLHGLHAAFTISKIHATLPWGLLSAALTTARLGGRLRDRGRARAGGMAEGRPASPARTRCSPTCSRRSCCRSSSSAAPLFGGGNPYEAISQPVPLGLVRSAVFAWVVVRLTGWLRARGLRFQL